jgi:hypothetical protein
VWSARADDDARARATASAAASCEAFTARRTMAQMPGRYAALLRNLTAPELEELAAILLAGTSSHPLWCQAFPDWPNTWPLEELGRARVEWRANRAGGYAGNTRLKESAKFALTLSGFSPSLEAIHGFMYGFPPNHLSFPHLSLLFPWREVDVYLLRVRPLPAWALSALTSGDVHNNILSLACSKDDVVSLGRLGCVCKAWAGGHLEPYWRSLVLNRWPRNGMVHLNDISWARKYRVILQHAMPAERAQRARFQREVQRLQCEYTVFCIATDPSDGALVFAEAGAFGVQPYIDGCNVEVEWDDDGVLMPPHFFELREGGAGWGARGTIHVTVLAIRSRDERVMHLAAFDVALGAYRDTEGMGERVVDAEDIHVFYGGQRGGESGQRILLPALGMPDEQAAPAHGHGVPDEPAFTHIGVEWFGARDGHDPFPQEQPSWRMTHLRLMLCLGSKAAYGSMAEAAQVPIEDFVAEGMRPSDLLAVLDTGDWA